MLVEFHAAAQAELIAAVEWYAERSEGLAQALTLAVEEAIRRISERPEAWPMHYEGTRRYLLARFPYSVVYRKEQAKVVIVAVAHAKRHPSYWSSR